MKASGLLIATALMVILAGGVYWSNRQPKKEDTKTTGKDESPKILSIPEGDIVALSIKRKDGSETVVKKDAAGKWALTSPKQLGADTDALNGINNTLSSLNGDRVVEEKAADLSQYGLNAPAVEVVITRKDGKTHKLLIGDDTPTGSGVYVMVDSDPRVYTAFSSTKTSLDKSWQDLRDKRLLTFDQDKLTRVELTAKKATVEFGKNNQNEWTILKPKPLRADGWQVEELIRKLKDARMDTGAAADFAGGTPVATAKVTDATGTQTIEVRKVKDDYYARSSVVEGVHKVTTDLGTGLDKSIDDFRNKKLFDFGFSDPSKIEVKTGANAPLVYAKTGDKWFQGPKQIDSTSLQNLVDKLRDLSASKFADTGFTTPVIEVAVTSNEGKRTERVAISKTGNDAFARRENEPSIYQLDGKTLDELTKAAGDVKEAQPEKKK
jgi:hypothetical protein